MRLNRNSWSSTSSTWPSRSARISSASRAMCSMPYEQVGVGRPALRHSGPQQLERGVADLARQQRSTRPTLACGVVDGSARCLVSIGSRRSSFDHRGQVVGQRRQSGVAQSAGDVVELARQRGQRLAAGGAQLGRRAGFDRCARRRHRVELVEEAVDRRRLRRRIGDVLAHQIACRLHGLVAEACAQLPDELLPQQLNLLRALRFDALGSTSACSRSCSAIFSASCRASSITFAASALASSTASGVHRVGVGELLRRLGALLELGADGLLLLLHHVAHRRHNPLHRMKTMTAKPMSCPMKVDIGYRPACPDRRLSRRRRASGWPASPPVPSTDDCSSAESPRPLLRQFLVRPACSYRRPRCLASAALSSTILRPSARASSRMVDASRRASAITSS